MEKEKKYLKEKEFFDKLNSVFVGAPISGYGGYVNLLMIKQKYYNKVIEQFKKEINEDKIIDDNFIEDFYNQLYNFFNRYFNECGSIFYNKTSYNDKIYEQVYKNNEDVSLFWKTNMLYYVKSDILFNNVDIKVRLDDKQKWTMFRFDVGELKNKQNNEKMELIFSLDKVVDEKHDNDFENKIVIVNAKLKEGRMMTESTEKMSKDSDIDEELFEKAISQFKKQATVDYFINKDAKKFLTEQLDLYIHNILLNEKSEFDEKRLNQLKTIKKYALKLISFISQFEDELVRIWNKPKFVLNSNYVISVDKINDDIIKKIEKHKNIKKQIGEWIELGMVDDGFKFNKKGLEQHPYLPIDTKYFKDLEFEIIGQFDNLDEELNGRLIHSENYQALNTIKNKYEKEIQCIYIDPPFNTGEDFEYIDGLQSSTWCTLMHNRFEIVKYIMSNKGSFYLHLDENADYLGRQLLSEFGFKKDDIKEVTFHTMAATDENASTFGMKNVPCKNFVQESQTIYYGRYIEKVFHKLWKPNRLKSKLGINSLDLIAELQPDSDPRAKESYKFYVEKYNNDNKLDKVYINSAQSETIYTMGDIWNDILSMSQSTIRQHGENVSFNGQKPEMLLRRIIQSSTNLGDVVMDYFAGTGTTAFVAHKLGRKWITMEMGNHYYEYYYDWDKEKKQHVLKLGCLGRLKNAINGDKTFKVPNSKYNRGSTLSKDINWLGGGFLKYYELEQYEDTLSRMKYNSDSDVQYNDDIYNQYIFFADEKLTECIENNDNIKIDLNKLYENIDLPETISFIYGEPIKRITSDEVILEKSGAIKYNVEKMNNEEKKKFISIIKNLIWWGK